MIYTVNWSKAPSFMKEAKGGLSLAKYNKEGDLISDSRYKRPHLPGVGRMYTPQVRKGRVLVSLDQKELNELVKEISFYDENGELITEAPKKNPGAKFWKHPDCKVFLEAGGTEFDDDLPLQKFWIKCFEADSEFHLNDGGAVNPAKSAKIKHNVVKAGEAGDEISRSLDEVVEATKMLANQDFDKRVKILRALGVDVRDPDPKTVERTLVLKITEQKDELTSTGERNIEQYIRLGKARTGDLNLAEAASSAWQRRILSKRNNQYMFGQIPVGRNLSEVENFLRTPGNEDVRDEILNKLKLD